MLTNKYKIKKKLTELINWVSNWSKRVWTYWKPKRDSGTWKNIQTLITSIKDLIKIIVYQSPATETLIVAIVLTLLYTIFFVIAWELPPWFILVHALLMGYWVYWDEVIRELSIILTRTIEIIWQVFEIFLGPIVLVIIDVFGIILQVIGKCSYWCTEAVYYVLGILTRTIGIIWQVFEIFLGPIVLVMIDVFVIILQVIGKCSYWCTEVAYYVLRILTMFISIDRFFYLIDVAMWIFFITYVVITFITIKAIDVTVDMCVESIILVIGSLIEIITLAIDALIEILTKPQHLDNNTSSDNPIDTGSITTVTDIFSEGLTWIIDIIKESFKEPQDIDYDTPSNNSIDSGQDTSTTDSVDNNSDKDTSTTDSADNNSDKDTSTTDSADNNSDKDSIKTSTVLDDLLEFINWILTNQNKY